ncbi:MAG: polysaccharide deacetylase family protein, partial [Paludibacter sp.]
KEPDWIENPDLRKRSGNVASFEKLSLIDSKYVEIGAHGVKHKNLSLLSTDEAYRELMESKTFLESIFRKKIDWFAFPYDGYTEDIIVMARKAGYEKVLAGQSTHIDNDSFLSGRIAASPDDWMIEYKLKILGAYNWLPSIIQIKNMFRSRVSTSLKNNT